MAWDKAKPVMSSALVSADIRANWDALDTMLVAPVTAATPQSLLKVNASDGLDAIAPGTNGYVLTLAAGTPSWAAPTPGMLNPMLGTGDMIRGDATGAPVRVNPGANGTWLTISGGIPAWASLPVDPGFANPMTASGDLLYGAASGVATRLAKGSDGQVLKLASGLPAWSADVGFTNPLTTLGDVFTGGAAGAPSRLGIGATNQVLTVVGGVPAWAAPAGGVTYPLLAPSGTMGAPSYAFASEANTGMWWATSQVVISTGGSPPLAVSTYQVKLKLDTSLAWTNLYPHTGTVDTELYRDAAGYLAQRSGTTPQVFRVYGTSTPPNGEYLELMGANPMVIRSNANGTGVQRNLQVLAQGASATLALGAGGAIRWTLDATGHFAPTADNTVDIGTGSFRVRVGCFATITIQQTASNATLGLTSVGGSGRNFSLLSSPDGGFYLNDITLSRTVVKTDTSSSVYLYMWDGAAASLRFVQAGAADSGGAGYRMLRTTN